MGYEEKDELVSDKNILKFHLSHKTNENFSYEPNIDTPNFLWKYLSNSNLLKNSELINIENSEQVKLIEKATHEGAYEEQELFDLYKRFQFDINQLINVNDAHKLLPDYQGRALLYQRLLLTSDSFLKLDLSSMLNKSFDELENVLLEVEKDITDGFSLEEISNKFNLELNEKKLIEKKYYYDSELPDELKKENFFNEVYNKKIDSDLFIEETEDGFFIVRVDEIIDEKPMEYKEAYNKIRADLKEIEIDKKTKKINEKFKLKIKEGEDFIKISDSLKMNSRTTKKVNRENLIDQGFSLEFTNKIFESKKNTIHEDKTKDKFYIVKVLSDSEIKLDEQKFNEIKKSVNQIYGIGNFEKFSNILEKKYPLNVNENVINEFIDRMQY